MPIPWFAILDTMAGLSDLARRVTRRPSAGEEPGDPLALQSRATGALEARLAGVVVAALKEAFDRDTQRLDLEREQLDAERQRAERALRLELARQAADREVARQRLVAGVAVVSLLATLFFSGPWLGGGGAARAALGVGWLLLLGAVSAAFVAQSQTARVLERPDEATAGAIASLSPSPAGAASPWLMIAGLAVIAIGVLLA